MLSFNKTFFHEIRTPTENKHAIFGAIFITTILACLFSVGVRISRKKLCWTRAWRRRWHLVSPTLYIIIVYRVNLNKLSRNFVGALRTTPTNCRVSFVDLYLVFPRNFRIVFSPHTRTVVLLEPYTAVLSESLGYLWQTLSALYPKVRLSPWRQVRENIHSGPRVPPELYSTHSRWGPLLVPRSS